MSRREIFTSRSTSRADVCWRRSVAARAVNQHRPSVDVLFRSLVKLRGVPIVGILLTGMGSDGADGLVELSRAGHPTIAEDEQSCVVFGMPREAILRGGARHVLPLLQIPGMTIECLTRLNNRSKEGQLQR